RARRRRSGAAPRPPSGLPGPRPPPERRLPVRSFPTPLSSDNLSCNSAPVYIHATICPVNVIGFTHVPRAYEQTARAESAAETRRQILDAVYGCLREEPSTPPSVGD